MPGTSKKPPQVREFLRGDFDVGFDDIKHVVRSLREIRHAKKGESAGGRELAIKTRRLAKAAFNFPLQRRNIFAPLIFKPGKCGEVKVSFST